MRRGRRAVLRVSSWAVLAAALAMPKLRTRLGLPRPVALGTVALAPAAAAVGIPRSPWRSYAVFLAQMWAYLRAFELTYAQPERLRRRLVVEAPIAVDRALGGGRTPTERLQHRRERCRKRELGDRLIGGIYFAWAAERHTVLLWLLQRHPSRFARAAALVGASFHVAWVIFSVMPVAPPWWAGKTGRLPGVRRVTVDASVALPFVPEQNEVDDDQGNPWASTPSQHAASAAMLAIVASEVDTRVGLAAWGYAAALGIALVYLGEHYLADVISGFALAVAIHRTEPLARVPARRIAAVVDGVSLIAWPARGRRRLGATAFPRTHARRLRISS
jgi:membrane-associated phospholipid phosphatase